MRVPFFLIVLFFSAQVFGGAIDSFPSLIPEGVHLGFNGVSPYDDCEITLKKTNGELFVGLKTTTREKSFVIHNEDTFKMGPHYAVQRWENAPSRNRRTVEVFEGDPDQNGDRYGVVLISDWFPDVLGKNSVIQCAVIL